ncbi:HNH endonuclease family protein [Specibacter sp. NPDC057265]|uniref:HNH endonuclease family protein n=1 Tax=Specibacter sp. NPDC057265 TaxID=3346075 RepID=UPI00362B525F
MGSRAQTGQPSQRGRARANPQHCHTTRPPWRLAVVLALTVLLAMTGWLHTAGRWPFTPDAGPPPVFSAPDPGPGQPVVAVQSGSALALLETLPVKDKAASSDYDRALFGAPWADADANGCDTRNDILRRDLQRLEFTDGSPCLVASGVLAEPYTAVDLAFERGRESSKAVQIDHVVALGNAWQTGAAALSPAQRESLANDPLNLLAVDGPANQEKSSADAASWLPASKKFRCHYVARQISVKASYRLWVAPAEKAAMVRVLGLCPQQQSLPSGYLHPAETQDRQ